MDQVYFGVSGTKIEIFKPWKNDNKIKLDMLESNSKGIELKTVLKYMTWHKIWRIEKSK